MPVTTFSNVSNNASARVTTAHAIGDGFLVVDSVANFPAAPFRVTALSGIFNITAVNTGTNTLTIGGMLEGTADVVLPINTRVEAYFTAGHLRDAYNAINSVESTKAPLNSPALTGVVTVTAAHDTDKPLAVKSFSPTQSTNLTEWQDSTGNVLSSFDPTGKLTVWDSGHSKSITLGMTSDYYADLILWGGTIRGVSNSLSFYASYLDVYSASTFHSSSAGDVAVAIKAVPSQTANLQEWQDSTGTANAFIHANGSAQFGYTPAADTTVFQVKGGRTALGSTFVQTITSDGSLTYRNQSGVTWLAYNPATDQFNVSTNLQIVNRTQGLVFAGIGSLKTDSSGNIILNVGGASTKFVVQAVASQTANIQEWQDNSATPLSYIRSDGSMKPASLTDSAAANDSIYFSTTAGKLVYKDASGVVNPLY